MGMLVDIETAFQGRVQALASEPAVAWEGVPFTPQKGVPYIACRTAARQRTPMGLGVTAHLWEGAWTIRVVHPAEEGLTAGYARAEAVLAWFPRRLSLVSGMAKIVVETGSIEPAYPTADWLNIPVTIRWFTEEAP